MDLNLSITMFRTCPSAEGALSISQLLPAWPQPPGKLRQVILLDQSENKACCIYLAIFFFAKISRTIQLKGTQEHGQ
jgi:hypothetical protein